MCSLLPNAYSDCRGATLTTRTAMLQLPSLEPQAQPRSTSPRPMATQMSLPYSSSMAHKLSGQTNTASPQKSLLGTTIGLNVPRSYENG